MNGMNEENQTSAGSEPRPVAYCQNCGKPLDHESKRVVGQSVYCEPCLAARLAGAPPAAGTGYRPVNAGAPGVWPAASSSEPNPGLAALLGLMPGVGAMYNEQYAKGIVHLVVFAVLVSFAHVTDVFVLFVFGWLAYMSIEAHHTAKARRDGTPLPNPFGLNDIGERLGFGKAWPSGPGVGAVARDAAEAAAAGFANVNTSFSGTAAGAGSGSGGGGASGMGGTARAAGAPNWSGAPSGVPAADPAAAAGASWGAPVDAGPYGPAYGAGYASTGYAQGYAQPYAQAPYGYGGYGTQVPYGPPMGVPMGMQGQGGTGIPSIPASSRFPAGAIWLIGLGTLFLLGTTGIFRGLSGGAFLGIVLIGLGVWVFVRRMMDTGLTLSDDGSPGYQYRVMRALRGAVWLLALGVLILLDTFGWVRWHYSWPWLVILAGVMMLLNRVVFRPGGYSGYSPGVPIAATGSPIGAAGVPMAAGGAPTTASPGTAAATPEPKDTELHEGGN